MNRKGKTGKKIAACFMGLAMAVISVNLSGVTAVKAETEPATKVPGRTAFATATELVDKSNFSLWKEDGGAAQKVRFGKKNTWYIAGADKDGALVLMCDPTNPFSTIKFLDTKKYNNKECINNEQYEGKDVYANHYGASDIRVYLNGEVLNAFTEREKLLMAEPVIYTNDKRNNCTYATSDKLYLPYGDYSSKNDKFITVGENSDSDLNNGIKIGLISDNGSEGSPYADSGRWFWLRTPHVSLAYNALYASTGGTVNGRDLSSQAPVVPAVHLKLSSVLFASAATAVSSDAALSDAMTFRINGEGKVQGTAVCENGEIKVTNGGAGEFIYIQYKDETGDKVWSKAITGDMVITKELIGVDSFANCKIWIEKKGIEKDSENNEVDTNLIYAVMAAVNVDGMLYQINTAGSGSMEAELVGPKNLTGDVIVRNEITFENQEIPVTKIADGIFRANRNIESVYMGDNVREMDPIAFAGCSSLREVRFSNNLNVTSVRLGMFTQCTSLKKINIPSSWNYIPFFCARPSLEEVVIPAGVTRIDEKAFYGCKNLKRVEFGGTKAQWEKLISEENCGEGNDALKDSNLEVNCAHVHSGGTATCVSKAVCTECKEEYGEVAAGKHTFLAQVNEKLSGQLVSAEDCTHPAVYKKYCKYCLTLGTETFEVGIALGHSFKGGAAQTKCDRCDFTREATKDVENLTVTSGVGEASLVWSPVPGAAKYAVYMKTSAGTTLLNGNVTTNSYKATGLSGGEKVGFTVRPYIDSWGSYSPVVWAMVHTPETAVASKVVVTTDMNQATVSWSEVSGASAYALYQKNADGSTSLVSNKITGTTYTVTGLADGARVGYCVRAKLGSTWYGYSIVTWVTLPAPAVPPTGVKAKAGAGKATVTWNEVPGAGRYALYKKSQSGAVTLISAEVTGNSYEVTGLTNGETVGFVLKSRTSKGWSTWSATGWTVPQSGK